MKKLMMSQEQELNQEFTTRDLFLVTYLLTKGFKFTRSPAQGNYPQNPHLINFYFLETSPLAEARQLFHQHEALVDAWTLLMKFRDMKSLTYTMKNQDLIQRNGGEGK
jgi:hypothetical protein